MFASFDPVALDMACVDAVNAQTPLRGSAAADAHAKAHVHDHLSLIHIFRFSLDWPKRALCSLARISFMCSSFRFSSAFSFCNASTDSAYCI